MASSRVGASTSPAAGAPNLEAWLNQHVHPDDAPRLRRRAAARWDETSLAVRDTFRTWSVMETVVSVVGLIMVLLASLVL